MLMMMMLMTLIYDKMKVKKNKKKEKSCLTFFGILFKLQMTKLTDDFFFLVEF